VNPCSTTECSLHQLAPYIGKLKSTIARHLIQKYTDPGDLIVDPFCGSGTIPLEAALLGRHVFASDVSPYARVLVRAKLKPPPSCENALQRARHVLARARERPKPDLRTIPSWVRRFFHPRTLREIVQLSEVCRRPGMEFLFACLLGILHQQRPGFLSYPSSHLVPYLRSRKFPRDKFPEMYAYRELEPRLLAKVTRAYKRVPNEMPHVKARFRQASVLNVALPPDFDCVVTSPPYMNALGCV
jgi:hypothetical protein